MIGSFSKKGEILVNKKDYVSLGKLMNVNHGLLDALGVGTSELSALVYAARNAGAYGAKITGAGGGGCMVALTDSPVEVASAIENAGGRAIISHFNSSGVKQE
jgi:mevalonate kinase